MNYAAILNEALALRGTPERASGCGRVYVCLSAGWDADEAQKAEMKRHIAGIKKAAGTRFQAKNHYGNRNSIYVGYDNCSGIELGRGTAIVEFLKGHGINCYRDEHGD